MPKTALEWIKPPSDLAEELMQQNIRRETALAALAKQSAARGQNKMKERAPWTDRTGNARTALKGRDTKEGGNYVVYFIHGVFHGVYLELNNSGRYAVVWPVTVEESNQLFREVKRLMR